MTSCVVLPYIKHCKWRPVVPLRAGTIIFFGPSAGKVLEKYHYEDSIQATRWRKETSAHNIHFYNISLLFACLSLLVTFHVITTGENNTCVMSGSKRSLGGMWSSGDLIVPCKSSWATRKARVEICVCVCCTDKMSCAAPLECHSILSLLLTFSPLHIYLESENTMRLMK